MGCGVMAHVLPLPLGVLITAWAVDSSALHTSPLLGVASQDGYDLSNNSPSSFISGSLFKLPKTSINLGRSRSPSRRNLEVLHLISAAHLFSNIFWVSGIAMAKNMLGKFFGYSDEKMQTLRNNIASLASQAADINAEVEDAELRTGKKRKHEVRNWLGNVERMKNEVQNLEKEVGERKFSSLLLGNRVDKLNGQIAELREQGRFQGGLILDVCETRGEPLLPTKLIGQEVEQNLKKILECLMADNLIGIWGMPGVGKT